MENNISGGSEKSFALGSQENHRLGKKILTEEAYLAGKNLGYNLGYNQGFESGYEKGYAEGSNLGYNNGFVAALRGEGEDAPQTFRVSEEQALEALLKLVTGGQAGILLTGPSAKEAEALFRAVNIEVTVIKRFEY
jgi:flagellar biosynthesis/type III secretory pathway protein FliH